METIETSNAHIFRRRKNDGTFDQIWSNFEATITIKSNLFQLFHFTWKRVNVMKPMGPNKINFISTFLT